MKPREFALKDSGERQTFDTGAQRDTSEGKGRFDLISPIALDRLAKWMEQGAKKYDARNWEKGMPLSRYYDSSMRHLNKFLEGQDDEDHLAAALFNIMALLHTEEMVHRSLLPVGLDDLPLYTNKKTKFEIDLLEMLANPEVKETLFGKIAQYAERVYVAGPFSSESDEGVVENIEAASTIGLQLADRGHLVHVPHQATAFMHELQNYEYFMDLDLSIIEKWATALYFVGSSPGADRELELAEKLGLTIWRSIDEVPFVAGR